MNNAKSLAVKTYDHFMKDSLYRNSIFLMANTISLAGFGFIFWALAAHLYSAKDVGVTATLITASTLVSTLSILGFDNSFIRYLPKSKHYKEYLHTGFAISTISSLLVSILYILLIKSLVPKLSFIDNSILWIVLFIIFMILNTLNNLTNFAFIAFRATHLILVINIGFGIFRILALVTLSQFGLNGLIMSYAIATTVALIITLVFMKKFLNYSFFLKINYRALTAMGKYAFDSYLSVIFLTLPTLVLPTLVISSLGAEDSAYYYIVAVIITALNVIPFATSQSLFAEGSWTESNLRNHFTKALKIIISLMIPAIAILIIFGKDILNIFGAQYADKGYVLLVLLSLAGIPKIFNYLLSTILRIQHKVRIIIAVYISYAIVVLVGSLWGFAHNDGLKAIGFSTFLAELLAAITYTIIIYRSPIDHLNK